MFFFLFFFFSSRRRHTRSLCDWSSDVCSSDLFKPIRGFGAIAHLYSGWDGRNSKYQPDDGNENIDEPYSYPEWFGAKRAGGPHCDIVANQEEADAHPFSRSERWAALRSSSNNFARRPSAFTLLFLVFGGSGPACSGFGLGRGKVSNEAQQQHKG